MPTNQKIVPNLWFDRNAKEAVDFYVDLFDGKITKTLHYPKSKEEGLADFQQDFAGDVLTLEFELADYRFMAINASSEFKPTPAISFFYTCDTKEEMDSLWAKLTDGGQALMPLDKYPFSDYYGWGQDKYGYSWQLILNRPEGDWRPKIVPSLLFTDKNVNHAEKAIEFYLSIFRNSKLGNLHRYEQDAGKALEGSLAYGDFQLENEWFAAMDSGGVDHGFTFNEAISLSIACADQAEIDYYWEKLSADPKSEVCGWCKDKYGVSWQVAPYNVEELLQKPGAFARMMEMGKLDIATLAGTD
jgi:predicted 3-demethylubiquinone-9 3-methyltransferase (glyoxalase superfamily)